MVTRVRIQLVVIMNTKVPISVITPEKMLVSELLSMVSMLSTSLV